MGVRGEAGRWSLLLIRMGDISNVDSAFALAVKLPRIQSTFGFTNFKLLTSRYVPRFGQADKKLDT